jgi:hypothetical protein
MGSIAVVQCFLTCRSLSLSVLYEVFMKTLGHSPSDPHLGCVSEDLALQAEREAVA